MDGWEVVIGLEVHAQVVSDSKLFSGARVDFGASPNTNVSYVDAALPGMLPVLNEYCVKQAVMTGLAFGGAINLLSSFDRKSYFYQDLPQGYQITQFHEPIVRGGRIVLDSGKVVNIDRLHIEQDAGKSIHNGETYVDLNRAGVALMEIVTAPDMSGAEEAAEFVRKLRLLLRYIGTCDGDMEKGSLRCDVNVSVRRKGIKELGCRCEIKNLNSMRYLIQAVHYEANRQISLIENGGEVEQSTMLFDVDAGVTRVMRTKENSNDYRYFPDPDLYPLRLTSEYVRSVSECLPELPHMRKKRYVEEFGINEVDAEVIIAEKAVAEYFDDVVTVHAPKMALAWITSELFGRLKKNELPFESNPITSGMLIELLNFVVDGVISGKLAKQVLDEMFETGKSSKEIVESKGLKQVSDVEELKNIVCKILMEHPKEVQMYKDGKDRLFGFFVGQVMKNTGGQANPETVNEILRNLLNSR